MRPILWFILIFAFSVGMCCAFTLRFCYFEAAPTVAKTPEPLTKILVAKRMIPSGVEITADSVVFQEVAVSEVPLGSLTCFTQVYRRQPAYPIPEGCPICEDLLLSPIDTTAQTAFLPLGSQFVTLDIVHIRQGDKVFSPNEPLSTVLTVDQHIDIRVVPRNEVQGKLADKKNEVLRAFASQDFRERESGELLLENVPIHPVQRQSNAGQAGSSKVLLVLDKSDATKLAAAAKKGQLRILVHQEPEKDEPQPIVVADVSEDVDASERTLLVSLPFESLPIDIPIISECTASVAMEPDPVPVPAEPTETVQKVHPEPKTADIFESKLPTAPMPDFALLPLQVNESSQNDDRELSGLVDSTPPELVVQEKIRNDVPKIAFGTPALRVISERSAEQDGGLTSLPTNVPGRTTYSEPLTEAPRSFQSLQFHSPGNVASTREYLTGMTKQTETVALPLDIPALTSVPMIVPGRGPGYSPFGRRMNSISSNEDLNEVSDELPSPPRLLRSSGLETQVQ